MKECIAYLRLALSEQELHALLNELGVRDELERDGGAITSTKDALRVVHGYDSYRLTHSLSSHS